MRLGGNASLRSSSSGYAASSDRCSGQGVGKAWVDDHRVISDIIQMLKSRRWADAPSTTAVYNHYDRCGEIPAVSLLSFAAPVASRSFSDNRKKRPLRCDGLLLWSRVIQGRQGAAPRRLPTDARAAFGLWAPLPIESRIRYPVTTLRSSSKKVDRRLR